MAMLYLMLLLSLQSALDATLYKMTVHTGTSTWAGTGDYVTIKLVGTNSLVMKKYNGFGPRFENNNYDNLEIEGGDIGQLMNVEAKLSKYLIFLDKWQLDWITISYNGNKYKAYFDYYFENNGEKHFARRIEILACKEGYEERKWPVPRQRGEKSQISSCYDRNECETACKSSGEICTNTPGSYICECKPGFVSDGTGCRDVNECAELQKDPCSHHKNSYCSNTEGSYECKCKNGYFGDYFACKDQDECQLKVHECSQICVNTPGSYNCGCKKGFKLAVDGKTCVDIDECSSPNPCNATTSICYDDYGSYKCICKPGYRSDAANPNTCIARTCGPVIGLDKNVILTPAGCGSGKNAFGDECKISCRNGYYLDSSSAKILRCGNGPFNGFITDKGTMPVCKPKLCPKITPPKNAYTVPPKCATVGTEQDKDCYIYCDGEFIMAGNKKFHCSMEKYDKDPSKALCTRIPRITCPRDVNLQLPADKGTVAIGNNYPNFRTNMRMDQVSSNIPGVGPSYEFKKGINIVQYIATNELNQTDSCSFAVQVRDVTPPVIEYCPGNQYLVSKGGDSLKVDWDEPRFKDNFGIKKMSQTAKSGEIRQPTTFDVSYTAYDYSGNHKSCDFQIHFRVLTCSFDSIIGGDQFINKNCINLAGSQAICMAHCPRGKTFDIINSKSYVKNMWNCLKADFGIARMPDCVAFVPKNGQACPAGYIDTLNYRVYTRTEVCGKCPRGTYYVNGTCLDCPRSTYQDVEGSMQCKKCPTGKGTLTTRNIFDTACKDLCPLGFVSKSGMSDLYTRCTLCPLNTFADKTGSTKCTKCPNGTTTERTGRSNANDCLYAPTNVTMVPSGVIEATAGDAVQFDCYARGNPLPSMMLRRVNSDVNPKTHGLTTTGETKPDTKGIRYFITAVSKYDAGLYGCRAENRKGIVYKQITLKVNDASGSGMGSNYEF